MLEAQEKNKKFYFHIPLYDSCKELTELWIKYQVIYKCKKIQNQDHHNKINNEVSSIRMVINFIIIYTNKIQHNQ